MSKSVEVLDLEPLDDEYDEDDVEELDEEEDDDECETEGERRLGRLWRDAPLESRSPPFLSSFGFLFRFLVLLLFEIDRDRSRL